MQTFLFCIPYEGHESLYCIMNLSLHILQGKIGRLSGDKDNINIVVEAISDLFPETT